MAGAGRGAVEPRGRPLPRLEARRGISEEADGGVGVGAYSGSLSLSLSPSISSAARTIKVCQDVVEARQLPSHYLNFWSQGDVLRTAVERVAKVHLTPPHSHRPPLPRRRLPAITIFLLRDVSGYTN